MKTTKKSTKITPAIAPLPTTDGLYETMYTITYDRRGRAHLVVIG